MKMTQKFEKPRVKTPGYGKHRAFAREFVSQFNTLFFLIIFFIFGQASCLVVGSDSAVSRQNTVRFPWSATDNELRGYTTVDSGFMLQDYATTCSFNAFFPVAEDMNLGGGTLFLQEDLSFSNTMRWVSPGTIHGNNQSVKIAKASSDIRIPYVEGAYSVTIRDYAARPVTAAINAVDWSPNSSYITACFPSSGATEVRVYSFADATPVQVATYEGGQTMYAVRWHPTAISPYYIAAGRGTAAGNDFIILRYTPPATLAAATGVAVTANTLSCAWHPGGAYIVCGRVGSIGTYNWTAPATILLNQTITGLGSINGVSFSPGANYVAIGETSIRIYQVAYATTPTPVGLKLTARVTISPGNATQTLDWCPTGTYIAAGFAAGTDRLRIYKHDAAANALTEVLTARIGEPATIGAVHWSSDGKILFYSTENTTRSLYAAYYFDSKTETMTKVSQYTATQSLPALRRSPNDLYLAWGTAASGNLYTGRTRRVTEPQLFYNTSLVLNSNTVVGDDWRIKGTCKIIGNDKILSFVSGKKIELMAGAQLTLENLELYGLAGSNLHCITSDGQITVSDCTLSLSSDYTFSTGKFVFDRDVVISGTSIFNYTSASASTISSGATLFVDNGVTFNYAPTSANKNLLVMSDVSSGLYLNGSTLSCTTTGLRLTTGTLYFDDHVTLSSQAQNSGQAMELSTGLNIQALAAAVLDVYGVVKYV